MCALRRSWSDFSHTRAEVFSPCIFVRFNGAHTARVYHELGYYKDPASQQLVEVRVKQIPASLSYLDDIIEIELVARSQIIMMHLLHKATTRCDDMYHLPYIKYIKCARYVSTLSTYSEVDKFLPKVPIIKRHVSTLTTYCQGDVYLP